MSQRIFHTAWRNSPPTGAQRQFGYRRPAARKIPVQPVSCRGKYRQAVPFLHVPADGISKILLALQPQAREMFPIARQRERTKG